MPRTDWYLRRNHREALRSSRKTTSLGADNKALRKQTSLAQTQLFRLDAGCRFLQLRYCLVAPSGGLELKPAHLGAVAAAMAILLLVALLAASCKSTAPSPPPPVPSVS